MYALSTDNVVKEMSDLREEESLGEQAKGKHKKIDKYNSLPLFWRSFAYFVFRYILKGGFLEGKEGLIFAFIQGWMYRMLLDAKVLEKKNSMWSFDGIRTKLRGEAETENVHQGKLED